jgi:HTH-type transcriptional regulator / antitoxin HigA
MSRRRYAYNPDYTIPPGEHIQEWLDTNRRTQAWLAEKMGRPIEQVNRLIKGRIGLTVRWGLDLEKVTKQPADFWLALEMHHRLFLARRKK